MTRDEQFKALLADLSAARQRGDELAREDAEWAMTRFLRGEMELPADWKIAQGGREGA